MRRVLSLVAFAAFTRASLTGAPSPPAPSIVRVTLQSEEDERQPLALPSEAENTVEVDFPWPVTDWAGRGFTPDADKFAGDFVVEATRGASRIFVTPVAAGAHRVLHVVLGEPSGASRGVPLEFIPAPAGCAWRKVVLVAPLPASVVTPCVSLAPQPPRTTFRAASAESEITMLRTLRLMLNTDRAGAAAIAASNPALQLGILDGKPRSFGDFTLSNRFALRDATTDTLGLCASLANATARRLLFDPESWVIRVGQRAYPVRTADFSGELEPGATAAVFLVLDRGPDGAPTLLLPDNTFELSVVLEGSVNPRPVTRSALEGFTP